MNKRFYTNSSNLIGRLADQAHEYSYTEYTRRLGTERADQVYFYDIFNKKFSDLIAEQCASMCMSQADRKNIRTAFGLPVESNIKYPGPEVSGSVKSQYQRKYNLPEN